MKKKSRTIPVLIGFILLWVGVFVIMWGVTLLKKGKLDKVPFLKQMAAKVAQQGPEKKEAQELSLAENIGKIDATIILPALGKKDEIVSNDYRTRTVSKTKGVKSKWLTTFILECVKKKIVSMEEAKNLLFELIKFESYISIEVYAVMQKKIDEM